MWHTEEPSLPIIKSTTVYKSKFAVSIFHQVGQKAPKKTRYNEFGKKKYYKLKQQAQTIISYPIKGITVSLENSFISKQLSL